jgi:putative transcriptional regulator
MLMRRNTIRQARETAGLTQAQLAERIGAGRVTVNRWEQGSQEPSLRQAVQLALALNLTLDELFRP